MITSSFHLSVNFVKEIVLWVDSEPADNWKVSVAKGTFHSKNSCLSFQKFQVRTMLRDTRHFLFNQKFRTFVKKTSIGTNQLLTEQSRSVWENIYLGRVNRPHCVRSPLTTSVKILPHMFSYLTIAIVAVSNKRPLRTNSNTEGPACGGADPRCRGAIWGTSEAHHGTTIHSNRIISAHTHYNLGHAKAKSEAVLIDGDVTGWARVKFVYHVTLQDDSYKFRMTWSLDLVRRRECLLQPPSQGVSLAWQEREKALGARLCLLV